LAAAAVVLDVDSLETFEQATVVGQAAFGYEPGLFAFRELPALLEALSLLSAEPDLLICDGHGYAHTERFGLACHAGLWTQIPTIGCAKTRFIGANADVGLNRGDRASMVDNGEQVGVALRTRAEAKPVIRAADHLARQAFTS
jgi:deoxyribonuclease V